MDERAIEERMRKLKKRGFVTDGVREHCDKCEVNGVWIYKILGSRVGGRDIRWCLNCGVVRSWRRFSDDQLVEDTSFDLDAFLA
jgi:hypothetical protein